MVDQTSEAYQIKAPYRYGRWLFVGLFLPPTFIVPYFFAVDDQPYPDLDFLLSFYCVAGFLWLMIPFDYITVTVHIETTSDGFWLKKLGRKMRWYPYDAIVAYNERPNSTKMASFDELTVYLTNNWFVLRSNEYKDYPDLRDLFTQYGKAVRHHNVITVPERNLIRWLIGGTAFIIVVNIVFGFLAYNKTDGTATRLVTVTDVVSQARANRVKKRLKGVIIALRSYPDFSFYVSGRNYATSLESLQQAILAEQPIELTIREGDFRKKLTGTEPLTFGDKYSDYREIAVFKVRQTNRVNLDSTTPVFEPKRTSPALRTILLCFLLLLCWTGWVFVDQNKVLRST